MGSSFWSCHFCGVCLLVFESAGQGNKQLFQSLKTQDSPIYVTLVTNILSHSRRGYFFMLVFFHSALSSVG